VGLPAPYYQDSAVTIYHGDCRDIQPQIRNVDLVLTDPPHGVNRDKGFGGFGTRIARRRFEQDEWGFRSTSAGDFRIATRIRYARDNLERNLFADILPRSTQWIF